MKPEAKKANILSIAGNIFLFIFKLVIGLMTNSIAVISDAMNSFMDSITSIITFCCMKIAAKHADKDHPFGHHRAEPIAAMFIAMLITIIGLEIIHSSFSRIFNHAALNISTSVIIVYFIVIIVKAILLYYTKYAIKTTRSEALRAMAVDHRNDIILSSAIIIGFVGIRMGYGVIDPILALLVAVYIIKSGWEIGLRNMKYLMGEAPEPKLLEMIKEKAVSVKGVIRVHDVKAHYIGLLLNVEIHAELDRNLKLIQAHDIEKEVQKAVQSLDDVERAFVHIDPL